MMILASSVGGISGTEILIDVIVPLELPTVITALSVLEPTVSALLTTGVSSAVVPVLMASKSLFCTVSSLRATSFPLTVILPLPVLPPTVTVSSTRRFVKLVSPFFSCDISLDNAAAFSCSAAFVAISDGAYSLSLTRNFVFVMSIVPSKELLPLTTKV